MHVVVVFLEAERGPAGANCATRYACTRRSASNASPGASAMTFRLDPLEGVSFLLYQVYDDEAAYLAHRELPHYADFRILTDPWVRHAPCAHL